MSINTSPLKLFVLRDNTTNEPVRGPDGSVMCFTSKVSAKAVRAANQHVSPGPDHKKTAEKSNG